MPPRSQSLQSLKDLPWAKRRSVLMGQENPDYVPSRQDTRANREMALSLAPVTGEAMSLRDAWEASGQGSEALMQGDYTGALGDYGSMALALAGAVPFLGMAGRAGKGIRAYHGSPHDFDQFQMDRIGTGEGHQAYGHGLYFAEEPSVARQYRDQETQRYGRLLTEMRDYGIPQEEADVIALSYLERFKHDPEHVKALINDTPTGQIIKDVVEGRIQKNPGRMYEVDINADPEDFLDWDKPLSEQSEKVRQGLRQLGAPEPDDISAMRKRLDELEAMRPFGTSKEDLDRSDEYIALIRAMGRADPKGSRVYYDITGFPTHEQKIHGGPEIQKFRESGIPGIKYLDQGSRTAGEGTRNYVVFDDKLINIVKKYGIAGALGAGLITADQAQALQVEGYE